MSDSVRDEPVGTCKSGRHPRTPKNTGTANTGRKFCRRCKYERAAERARTVLGPRRRERSKPGEAPLSAFEIERILSTLTCMGCGVAPTRRGVGEDGTPRWLNAPVTEHGHRCPVGARRQHVRRDRGTSEGVAA
jgi:hypothetical protein